MSSSTESIAKTISLIQLTQMLTALAGVIYNAVANGQDEVTADELAASFADKDDALADLRESIAKAKAEGR